MNKLKYNEMEPGWNEMILSKSGPSEDIVWCQAVAKPARHLVMQMQIFQCL